MKHLYWTGSHRYGRANEVATERMKRAGLCDPGDAPKPRAPIKEMKTGKGR